MQMMRLEFSLARLSDGSSIDARTAIIAITTSNSISEKYDRGAQAFVRFF
jgi:hypothetical protein